MDPVRMIKNQLEGARETFIETSKDIKPEHLHKDPGGKAPTLAAAYAHLIFSEDAIVQGMIQGKTPLYKSNWQDKTGVSEPMPEMDEQWSSNNAAWSKSVQVEFNQMRKYADAVFANTDAYVNGLTEEDLIKEIDLGDWGKKTVVYLLSAFIVGHYHNLAGEISAIKGVFGETGYPF